MLFNEYLQNLPRLHSWDGGKSWNTGGFNAAQREKLHGFLLQALPAAPVMLETGAGNSTLTLLYLRPQRLVSIAPDVELESRIRLFCQENSIDDTSLEFHADGSQWVLPELAISNRRSGSILDFALIDGSHGWPTAFVHLEWDALAGLRVGLCEGMRVSSVAV